MRYSGRFPHPEVLAKREEFAVELFELVMAHLYRGTGDSVYAILLRRSLYNMN